MEILYTEVGTLGQCIQRTIGNRRGDRRKSSESTPTTGTVRCPSESATKEKCYNRHTGNWGDWAYTRRNSAGAPYTTGDRDYFVVLFSKSMTDITIVTSDWDYAVSEHVNCDAIISTCCDWYKYLFADDHSCSMNYPIQQGGPDGIYWFGILCYPF